MRLIDVSKNKYFSFDNIEGFFELHETLEKAKENVEMFLEEYRDFASSEGWEPGLLGAIGYGEIKGTCVEKKIADKNDFTDEEWEESGYSSNFEFISDYNIEEID